MNEVTTILSALEKGDAHVAEQLLPLVYEELRRLASRKLAQEAPDHTLQATALVHEAYLRLVDVEKARHWDSRRHFFAAASEAMRRILIDRARNKRRFKRGGGWRRLHLDQIDPATEQSPDDLLALDEALSKLALDDPVCAELVKLRLFAGLTLAEAAGTLGIARRTADRYWAFARSWLYDALSRDDQSVEDNSSKKVRENGVPDRQTEHG
jgi:RNA polymerase sigma factor (TIGR02999 family)